jgi:hypothetical protein
MRTKLAKRARKLRAASANKPRSEMTKLKSVWLGLSEDARAEWSQRFVSDVSQAQIRAELLSQYECNLRADCQMNEFRHWVDEQKKRDQEAERQEDDQRRTMEEHPDWTKDQVRDDMLKKAYYRARSDGDFKLGLRTVAEDAKLEALQFDKEKFTEALRTKIQAGLDAILAEGANNPVIKAAVEQIQAQVAPANADKA